MPDLHKKTALDDDASIYNTDRERTERQKWGEMDKEQRIQYFADYYLKKLVGILAALAAAAFLFWHMLKPADETVLYAAVVDESLDEGKLLQMTEELNERLGADGKHKKVLIDDTFFMKDDALTRIEVYLHSNQLDVIIADEDMWRKFAGYGFLKRLDGQTGVQGGFKETDKAKNPEGSENPVSVDYKGKILATEGYLDSDDISFADKETAKGEAAPYGVDISQSRRFKEAREYMEHPVFAVAEGTEHEEQARDFLDYLME